MDGQRKCMMCQQEIKEGTESTLLDMVATAFALLYKETEKLAKQEDAGLAVQEQIRRNVETMMHAWDGLET